MYLHDSSKMGKYLRNIYNGLPENAPKNKTCLNIFVAYLITKLLKLRNRATWID